jgi:hypothetical protein
MTQDIKAEYIRRFAIELTDFGGELLEHIKNPTKSLEQITLIYASKIYDISNADFEENYNSDHRKEQNGTPF